MSEKHTGGPAFPEVRVRNGDNYNPPTKFYYGGMTLRDYFAAKVLQGIISDPSLAGKSDYALVASSAYMLADAMLEARK